MTHTLAIMGSGETTPTMVTSHQRILAGIPPERPARLLDTPYGFQANADELSAKARTYFRQNVGRDIEVLSLRSADALTPVGEEQALAQVRAAGWLFAGPGSPTYLARHLLATRLPDALRSRLGDASPGATVLASAAACTLGARIVPVYEIYKAGEDPHWRDGLDLLAGLDLGLEHPLDVVVVPHYDNAEGGTHDTRFCYLGETRLRAMEAQLPSGTWVLGVDEHTALVADLATGDVRVEGRGGVTVRTRDTSRVFASGTTTSLAALVAAAHGPASAPPARRGGPAHPDAADADATEASAPRHAAATPPGGSASSPLLEALTDCMDRFDTEIAQGDALAAAEATVGLEAVIIAWGTDVLQSDELDRARAELRRQIVTLARLAQDGLHEHRDLVAPHVDALLALRERARSERRFADADVIRDALLDGGVEVRDAAEGTVWHYHEPTTDTDPPSTPTADGTPDAAG